MIARRRFILLGPIGLLVVGGCGSSPDPVLYTLAAQPGSPQGGGPRAVMLRDVGLARYLDRPQIVRASDGYLLDVSRGDWWGEPLGRMIGRVLVEELAQRLPGSSVFAELGAITADADATVEVNMQSFAADASGQVITDGAGGNTATRACAEQHAHATHRGYANGHRCARASRRHEYGTRGIRRRACGDVATMIGASGLSA